MVKSRWARWVGHDACTWRWIIHTVSQAEDCVTDGRIILKSVLKQYGIRMLTGFIRLRTEISDEVLLSTSWILKFRKSRGISRVSQWLPASQEDCGVIAAFYFILIQNSLHYFNAYLPQNQGHTNWQKTIIHKIPLYNCDISVRFEVPTMVLLKFSFFWDFMLCP